LYSRGNNLTQGITLYYNHQKEIREKDRYFAINTEKWYLWQKITLKMVASNNISVSQWLDRNLFAMHCTPCTAKQKSLLIY
jgi:hypothetical protein